jgi:hypothetical protein
MTSWCFQRCSDAVKSRVEQAIRDAESHRTQLLFQFRNSPGALAFIGGRGLLTTTRRGEPALSIDQFGALSIDHIGASASPRSTMAIEVV